jgi:hypothetical protein
MFFELTNHWAQHPRHYFHLHVIAKNIMPCSGTTWEEAEALIPKGWPPGTLKKGAGTKYTNPEKRGNKFYLKKVGREQVTHCMLGLI